MHFSQCGKIERVRLIRDPVTFKGKGFAYIKFAESKGYLNGLGLNKSTFMTRELRVSKAVKIDQEKKKKFKKKQVTHKRFKGRREDDLVETKSAIMKNFVKKTDLSNDMTETKLNAIFQNNGVVPRTAIAKKIKKLKKKGLSKQKLHEKVMKVKRAAHKKIEDQVFNKGDMMKKRRDDRKKRKEINAKKGGSFKKKIQVKKVVI